MTMYSVTANAISYLDFVQKASKYIDDYPARTLLLALYGTHQYYVLEAIVAVDEAEAELNDFVKAANTKIVDYIKTLLPKDYSFGFELPEEYDPSIRVTREKKKKNSSSINKEPEYEDIGFIDLPSFTFYYYDSEAIEKLKTQIEKKEKQIKRLRRETKKLIEDYSYENKQGLERAISYALRKNNAEAAKKESTVNTKKIVQLQDEIYDLQDRIRKQEAKEAGKYKEIKQLEDALLKNVQMPSKLLKTAKEDT